MPTKKTGKTVIKPPSHVQDSLKKKASEVNDTTKLLGETKQVFDRFKTVTEVNNKKTEETTGTENAAIETKRTMVDASWSDFPEAHKLLKVANQKRSNNDLRGAIAIYIQAYNNLEKVGKIPSKRLTLKIISKIACTHIDLGEYEEASRALENAAWVQMSLSDLLYNEAKVAVDRNEIGRAGTLISEAMDLWKKNTNQSEDSLNKYVQILEMGSKVLFSAKKFKKSVEAYSKIIENCSQLDTTYLIKRRENYINFTQLINDDVDLIRTVTEEYDLADIVVDCSMSKTFCFYKGKNCYKNLDLALNLSMNNASLQTNSFRIFIHSGVYEWPQKATLQAFLLNFEATSKQKSILRVTGASDVVFLPNTNNQGDSIEIVEFPSGEIYFKNVFFGEIKSSVRFSVSFGDYQKGFLLPKPFRKLTLYFERKTYVYFESCRFSNIKIESRTTLSKSDRSSLTFDFCHFENDDCDNFEFSSAPWWKVSLSNCAVKQNNDTTGVVAKINCHLTLSNTDIEFDNYKTGNKLLVMGDTAKLTATGCCFGSKNSSEAVKLVEMKEEALPSKNNTTKLWDGQAILKPWNDIHHKPHDMIVLNGATCYIEKSYIFWNIRVHSSDVTIKQCLISDFGLTQGKVGEAVALEKNGKMSVIGNTFKEYTLGIKVSMGAEPLIDKNKFLEGSFCAILVQQQSAPIIRRNSFQEGETLGQMCAILYLPEFSCGRIEHNTFQDFSFQPIVIFRENKVEIIHNSYVDIDYMRNALPNVNSLCPPKPWFMISAQHYLLKAAFKTTYDDIFPNKMLDVNRYNVVSEIGCVMMERRWPNDDISEFWKSGYETKIKKKIPSCTKHKTAQAMHEDCVYCDTVYETGSESDEETCEDTDDEDEFSSKSDDWFLDHLNKTVKQGQIASAQMIQRKKDIEKKRKKRDAERASREKEKRKRQEERTKEKADNRLRKDTYIAVLGGAQLKECFSCGKVKIKVQHCSGCKLVFFCDTVCQKAGWSCHKVLCKIVSL